MATRRISKMLVVLTVITCGVLYGQRAPESSAPTGEATPAVTTTSASTETELRHTSSFGTLSPGAICPAVTGQCQLVAGPPLPTAVLLGIALNNIASAIQIATPIFNTANGVIGEAGQISGELFLLEDFGECVDFVPFDFNGLFQNIEDAVQDQVTICQLAGKLHTISLLLCEAASALNQIPFAGAATALQTVSNTVEFLSANLECIAEIAWTAQSYGCGKTEGFITGFEIGCVVCGLLFPSPESLGSGSSPPSSSCGNAADGDCCAANGSPGCENAECCAAVCGELPECCAVEWTADCADFAQGHCPDCLPFSPSEFVDLADLQNDIVSLLTDVVQLVQDLQENPPVLRAVQAVAAYSCVPDDEGAHFTARILVDSAFKGDGVTQYFGLDNVDLDSFKLNGVPAFSATVKQGVIHVKFGQGNVNPTFEDPFCPLTAVVIGTLDDGTPFVASDPAGNPHFATIMNDAKKIMQEQGYMD